jgi:hypothetical protein
VKHIFHVGLTKCASTSIQRYFEAHPGIALSARRQVWRTLVSRNSLYGETPDVSGFFNSKSNGSFVHSHERLSGNPHSGHYDLVDIARRIRAIPGDVKIVIFIREQYQLLASCYSEYVTIGGTLSFDRYLTQRWNARFPVFDPTIYRYDRLLEFYDELFGRDNVWVGHVEGLARSPEDVLRRLCRFIGVEYFPFITPALNPKKEERWIAEERIRNVFCEHKKGLQQNIPVRIPRILRSLLGSIARRQFRAQPSADADFAKATLPGYFADSNTIARDRIGEDLESYGYSL